VSREKLGDPVANRVGPRARRVDVTQVFDCERPVLFTVWTDPEHFARWWGPKEWQAYDCMLDVRPGGRWRSSFRRPVGQDIHIGGQYLDVTPPERISFSWNSYGTLSADDESLVELEFVEIGHQTELRITHTKLTTGEAEDMDIGWVSALESLARYLREQPTHIRQEDPA
jgi:uncharacterized protein YndB with AHSA1/START domain